MLDKPFKLKEECEKRVSETKNSSEGQRGGSRTND
jgi:hypothetical protein